MALAYDDGACDLLNSLLFAEVLRCKALFVVTCRRRTGLAGCRGRHAPRSQYVHENLQFTVVSADTLLQTPSRSFGILQQSKPSPSRQAWSSILTVSPLARQPEYNTVVGAHLSPYQNPEYRDVRQGITLYFPG